jgi:transposase
VIANRLAPQSGSFLKRSGGRRTRGKGLAPLACKTDKIDARVLALLSQRDLVPEIWLPDPAVRRERELARFRLHLVKHRSMLKHRVHATMITFGHPCPVTDLFGVAGRELLDRLKIPQPWRATVDAGLQLMDDLDEQIQAINKQLRALSPEHRYMPLLMMVPGIGFVLSYTIAAEIGDIARFSAPNKLVGYTGLCPRVNQSGDRDRRGPLTKQGPEIPALGDARSNHARPQARRLPRALPAQQAPTRKAARREGRADRHRPTPDRSDLAHADPQPAVHPICRRLHSSSGRLTALLDLSPRRRPPMTPSPAAEQAIER